MVNWGRRSGGLVSVLWKLPPQWGIHGLPVSRYFLYKVTKQHYYHAVDVFSVSSQPLDPVLQCEVSSVCVNH